ncbi:50S ribosomal protein L11 methyltransferase [Hyphomicrobium sp.]|uniref:50S ribosomal protein L11 methyltransferase n=1 Tax=Hyphomicrobium sp. TaxID=82 RepID=UPI002D7764B1|nr:50S ribosomal protein L11 methyltransferase [Hyphomicrobium sp.]HET6389321.1 50S ribosomal protein L11 methyltransferase [Hyphomicrobium sp.]
MRIEYHRTLIADQVRNEAFFAALKAVIVPGKSVVADIGAGTGLLGLMASKLGAREVFLFETAEVASVAAAVLKANKAKNCHLIPCHSTEFRDKLAADIIVSETLGNYALEENIIATLADARRRFLKPGGHVIPNGIIQYVAPVVSPRIDEELRAWERVGHGLDLGVAQTMSFNNAYVRHLPPAEILDGCRSAMVWDEVDLTTETKSKRRGDAEWRLPRPAKIFGFATWWKAELVPGIGFSTGPLSPRTHWEQLYFPLLAPIDAKASDVVAIDLRSSSSEEAGTDLGWTALHKDPQGKVIARQALSLDKGYIP